MTHGILHLLLMKEHSCCRPKRTGERKRKSIQGCTVDANRSVLNLVMVKKGRKIFLVSLILLCLIAGGPKEPAEPANFSISPKKMMSANRAPKIQHLVTPRVLQHKCQHVPLKKQCTRKNKEEAGEHAKLLAKRMKEPKEKRQEQIAKRHRLSSLRASIFKSESVRNEIFYE